MSPQDRKTAGESSRGPSESLNRGYEPQQGDRDHPVAGLLDAEGTALHRDRTRLGKLGLRRQARISLNFTSLELDRQTSRVGRLSQDIPIPGGPDR